MRCNIKRQDTTQAFTRVVSCRLKTKPATKLHILRVDFHPNLSSIHNCKYSATCCIIIAIQIIAGGKDITAILKDSKGNKMISKNTGNVDTSAKALFKMSWPIFIELLLNLLVGNMDQVQLSHFNGTAVAAVGNANQAITVVILTFNVITLASMILISQYRGAQDTRNVNRIYTLSIIVNLILSVAMCILLLTLGGALFAVMGVPPELMDEALTYLRIAALSLPFQALMTTFSAFLRANTRMKVIMCITGLVNLCNIGGNAILINGLGPIPQMGAAGAALSSAIFRGVGLVLMAVAFFKSIPEARISISLLKPFPTDILKRLLAIGLPSGGESFSYNLSQMITLTFINAMGTAVVTTRMYSVMIATCVYMLLVAVSQAGQVLVGYLVGARRMDEAHSCSLKILKLFGPITIAISFVVWLLAEPIFGLFTTNPEIIALGRAVLFVDIFLEAGRTCNVVFVRSLQATGDVRFPVLVGIASQWIIAVGLSFLLGVVFNLGLIGIWIAFAIDENVRGVIFLIRWQSGRWRKKADTALMSTG